MANRIQFRRDTLANWQKANPILMEGELALIATDPTKPGVYDSKKVGDGVHAFNDLEMLGYECLQELGDSTTFPVSQKVVTENILDITNPFVYKDTYMNHVGKFMGNAVGYSSTPYLPILNANIKIRAVSSKHYAIPYILFFDKDLKLIDKIISESDEYNVFQEFTPEIPEGAAYFVVNALREGCYVKWNSYNQSMFILALEVADVKSEVADVKSEVADVKSEVADVKSEVAVIVHDNKGINTNGYVVGETSLIQIASIEGFVLYEISCKKGDVVNYSITNSTATASPLLFNTSGVLTFIGSEFGEQTGKFIVEENGTVYIQSYKSENPTVKVTREKWVIPIENLNVEVNKLKSNVEVTENNQNKLRNLIINDKTQEDYELIGGYVPFNQEVGTKVKNWKNRFYLNSANTTQVDSKFTYFKIEDFYKLFLTAYAASDVTRSYFFFDDEETLLGIGESKVYYNNTEIEIPKGSKWIALNSWNYSSNPLEFRIEISKPIELEQKIEDVRSESLQNYPLAGKKIVMLGDSITEFSDANGKRISEYFEQLSKATIYNCAIGGSSLPRRAEINNLTEITNTNDAYAAQDVVSVVDTLISKNYDLIEKAIVYLDENNIDKNLPILETIKSVDLSEVDIVTIFAGTNSYGYTIADTDECIALRNIQGAVNYIAREICTNYPHISVYFFTPIPRMWKVTKEDGTFEWHWSDNYFYGDGRTYSLENLCEAIQKAAKRNHLAVCDMYYGIGWNQYNFWDFCGEQKDDGTHPYRGFSNIAAKMYSFIISNMTQI